MGKMKQIYIETNEEIENNRNKALYNGRWEPLFDNEPAWNPMVFHSESTRWYEREYLREVSNFPMERR